MAQHAYASRSCNINPKALLRYINVASNVSKNTEDPFERDLVTSNVENVKYLMERVISGDIQSRYEDTFPGIYCDLISVLECVGGTASAKSFQVIYSLANYLPELLAFICDEDGVEFRKKLEANCAAQNISLHNLSHALCNVENPLLGTVLLDPLSGISDSLDAFMSDILNHPENCIVYAGNDTIDLTSSEYTLEDRISTLLSFHLAGLEQYIFDMIIQDYCDNPMDGILLTSKGLSCLVFQASAPPRLSQINITLGKSNAFELKPVVLNKGDYLTALQKGWV